MADRPDIREVFLSNVRRIMEDRDLSSADLVRMAGLTLLRAEVALIVGEPTLQEVDKIAEAIGVTAADLLRPPE